MGRQSSVALFWLETFRAHRTANPAMRPTGLPQAARVMFWDVLFPLLHFQPVLCKLLPSLCGTGAQRWQRLLSRFPFGPEEMDFRLLMDASFSGPSGFFVSFLANSKWILSTLVQGRLTAAQPWTPSRHIYLPSSSCLAVYLPSHPVKQLHTFLRNLQNLHSGVSSDLQLDPQRCNPRC